LYKNKKSSGHSIYDTLREYIYSLGIYNAIEIDELIIKGCKDEYVYSRFMPETVLCITNACTCDLN